jgi:hypothetical protein
MSPSPPPAFCSYLPSLVLQSELAHTCDIQLFDMSEACAQQQQQPQQMQLGAGVMLPCMLRFESCGLQPRDALLPVICGMWFLHCGCY